MNNKEVSADIVALEQQNLNVRQVEELYGDGLPYDYNRLISKGQGVAQLAYQSMQELGRICIRIKVHEPHGKYLEALEMMSIASGDAWFAVQSVIKLGDVPNYSPVNNLGKRKIRAILTLDKPDIKTYLEGGDLITIPHDDVEQMSSRALEDEVRKLRTERKAQEEKHAKQVEALEEVVRKKESTISELEMEVAGRQPPTKEQVAENLLAELRVPIMRELAAANESVRRCIRIIDQAENINGVTQDQLTSFSEQCSELFSLLDDNYQNFCQAMEYITPGKPEA